MYNSCFYMHKHKTQIKCKMTTSNKHTITKYKCFHHESITHESYTILNKSLALEIKSILQWEYIYINIWHQYKHFKESVTQKCSISISTKFFHTSHISELVKLITTKPFCQHIGNHFFSGTVMQH